jgi:hypothetical protein
MHFVAFPRPSVVSFITPGIAAFSFDVVTFEVSFVDGPVYPFEDSVAVLFAILVLSFVDCTVWPSLCSESRLLIFYPLS